MIVDFGSEIVEASILAGLVIQGSGFGCTGQASQTKSGIGLGV